MVHDFPGFVVQDEMVDLKFVLNPEELRSEFRGWRMTGLLERSSQNTPVGRRENVHKDVFERLYEQSHHMKAIDWQGAWKKLRFELEAIGIDPFEFVVSWIQHMPYESGNEREKYAAETFLDGAGDCSDKSHLAMDVLRNMGFLTGLVVFEEADHMGLALACNSPLPDSLVFEKRNGANWVYIECTNPAPWGEIPERFSNGQVMRGSASLILPGPLGVERCESCLSIIQNQAEVIARYGPNGLALSLEEKVLKDDIAVLKEQLESRSKIIERKRKVYERRVQDAIESGCLVKNLVVNESHSCAQIINDLRDLQATLDGDMRKQNEDVENYNDMVEVLNSLMHPD